MKHSTILESESQYSQVTQWVMWYCKKITLNKQHPGTAAEAGGSGLFQYRLQEAMTLSNKSCDFSFIVGVLK